MTIEESDPYLGADVVFEDAVITGDLVILVPRSDGKVAVRRLQPGDLDSVTGRVFQIGLGAPGEAVSIRLFREARRPDSEET